MAHDDEVSPDELITIRLMQMRAREHYQKAIIQLAVCCSELMMDASKSSRLIDLDSASISELWDALWRRLKKSLRFSSQSRKGAPRIIGILEQLDFCAKSGNILQRLASTNLTIPILDAISTRSVLVQQLTDAITSCEINRSRLETLVKEKKEVYDALQSVLQNTTKSAISHLKTVEEKLQEAKIIVKNE